MYNELKNNKTFHKIQRTNTEFLSTFNIIALLHSHKNKRFDWSISGPSKAVLDGQKGVWDRKSKVYINKQTKWTIETF